ncbi:MAG: hypothetical protein IJO65_00530 [Lachnospiraceae bacterium]|nr:hypothetical protein [Lachnospiraceae bacterium]
MNKAIEITDFPKTDYMPLVDYEGWRVAVLASCENTTLPKIKTMQKHDETDEVFVLTRGNCTLITAGCGEKPGELTLWKLEPQKVYNVKKGFWHNHILDEEGVVVIVENADTCDDNSPILPLDEEQLKELAGMIEAK